MNNIHHQMELLKQDEAASLLTEEDQAELGACPAFKAIPVERMTVATGRAKDQKTQNSVDEHGEEDSIERILSTITAETIGLDVGSDNDDALVAHEV